MSQIQFSKSLKLSLTLDFNKEVSDKLKNAFYKSYMEGYSWFFLKEYEYLFTIENLIGKGYNEVIAFSELSFDKSRYNFDEPMQMTDENKNKPNFPFIPFTAKSVIYNIENSGVNFYDLTYNDKHIKITTEQINLYKLVGHKP